jgi:glycogen phosphorylase
LPIRRLPRDHRGDRRGWITDLNQLQKLKPLADDKHFRDAFPPGQARGKVRFADWLRPARDKSSIPTPFLTARSSAFTNTSGNCSTPAHRGAVQPAARQPRSQIPPRTFFFAGKAAPAYHLAKVIIKFINNLAGTIDGDPGGARQNQGRLPAGILRHAGRAPDSRGDVSNQISTAGYEASGTSNMKFMMNGALTLGTRDGATIEMAEEAGEENFFLFGLTAKQVADSRGWYNPHWHYDHEPETRAALDLIFSDYFSRYEPGVFNELRDTLLTRGDHYMHLADLKLSRRGSKAAGVVCRSARLGAQGDFERRRFREILQRPNAAKCRRRSRRGPIAW